MFTHRVPIFKLLGFQVWIDWSWLILALLITWSLATAVFPALVTEELTPATRWAMGAAGALGLFISIVLHELGHSVVARRFGMRMNGITLFVFGGVAEMGDEPPSPRAEFFMAIAGPLVSVAIGLVLLATTALGAAGGWPVALTAVTSWLGTINLILAGFNIIPAFPLDGGRVLRAALWHFKHDLRAATRTTSNIGAAFGGVMILLGALALITGNTVGGIWWIILGLFIRAAARSSYEQVVIRSALGDERVSRFMSADPVTVESSTLVRDLISDYFFAHFHKLYPVTEHGRLIGCVTIADVKALEAGKRQSATVADITRPCNQENTIAADALAVQALDKLRSTGDSRLMVVEHDRVVGILALKDLMQFLTLKAELEGR